MGIYSDHSSGAKLHAGNYASEAAALAGKPTVSIVNMVYSPGPEGDRIAKFYVYDVDDVNNDGDRLTSTVFDSTGEELFVPAACYSCHGGDDDAEAPLPDGYNEGSGETNATFLLASQLLMVEGKPREDQGSSVSRADNAQLQAGLRPLLDEQPAGDSG